MKRCYDFGPDQVASIDELSKKLRIDKTDVLTNGLRLLRIFVRASEDGNTIAVARNDRVVKELVGPWNEVAQTA